MADNQPGRSRAAGDRNRAQRLQARRLQKRQDFWEAEGDRSGRAHRRSRLQARRRS